MTDFANMPHTDRTVALIAMFHTLDEDMQTTFLEEMEKAVTQEQRVQWIYDVTNVIGSIS